MPGQKAERRITRKRQDRTTVDRDPWPDSDPLSGSRLKDDRRRRDEYLSREKRPIEMTGISEIIFSQFSLRHLGFNLEWIRVRINLAQWAPDVAIARIRVETSLLFRDAPGDCTGLTRKSIATIGSIPSRNFII